MRLRRRKQGRLHQDWLSQVETDGPFLSLPVLMDIWPNGVDRLGDTDGRLVTFKEQFPLWEQAFDSSSGEADGKYSEVTRAWVEIVLDELAEWEGLRLSTDHLPPDLTVQAPAETITVSADAALPGRDDGSLICLVRVVPPTEDLHAPGVDGWSASEIDRTSALLRKAGVPIGIVTDGRWWGLVWAGGETVVGSGIVDALDWGQERELRDAFLTLINKSTLRPTNRERGLPRLFERSVLEAEEITEALGVQVRKSVELLVQSFSESRLAARAKDLDDPLCEDPGEIYDAAVTVMMRVVFLLFAEERGMLPTPELYRAAYGVSELLDDLLERAQDEGEENLDHSFEVWHRLLATSTALFGGSNFDEARLPAYGGSLFDPGRFPWLTAIREDDGLRLRVSDRVMLHVLESVQVARVSGEARRISFRDVDVEQIGYIYEGLLGYTCREVTEKAILGLWGKEGEEPEADLDTLNRIYEESADAKEFASRLLDWVKEAQPAAKPVSASKIAKQYDAEVDDAEVRRLLKAVIGRGGQLLDDLVYWSNLIRRDLRGLPYVVPRGGLVVTETPSRKNAGAHYTPRSLAEEVVFHALQPLVYEPGPLKTKDEKAWRLKSSSAILDLKIADIAAGSGAFLVAAARYLADRLVEAWVNEDIIGSADRGSTDLRVRAIREVIAHCLYGADINAMAVEMCKLSLWLVSMDPTRPFSFVDDKVFHGNSLLGLTSVDQLRHMHIAPHTKQAREENVFVDVDSVLAEATRIRHLLTSPVDDDDPQRSRNGKLRLLEQSEQVTAQLRLIADGIIAAGLKLGGKPGSALDNAYKALEWALIEAFPADGSVGDRSKLNQIIQVGLTPTVETDYERWQPLHWVLEAPDVTIEHGGFDAIVGNPPFLSAKKITLGSGKNVRDFLVNHLAGGRAGNADLCAYFILRGFSLGRNIAEFGQLATDTIAQGDTREVALDPLHEYSITIGRAIASMKWPVSSASVQVAVLWFDRPAVRQQPMLNGDPVRGITATLEAEPDVAGIPSPLRDRYALTGIGSKLRGTGFLLTSSEAHELLAANARNAQVVKRFVGGVDLVQLPTLPDTWVIDFGERDEDEAASFSGPFEVVVARVKPERMTKRGSLAARWWQFEARAKALYRAMDGLGRVIALPEVGLAFAPQFVSTGIVFSHKVVVFPYDNDADLAILQSCAHEAWARRWGTTMDTRLSYTPSAIARTFPAPTPTERLTSAGQELDTYRRDLQRDRALGLTDLYNLVNSRAVCDEDIQRLRALHVEIDHSALAAYGWDDVSLQHGFHTHKQVERFSISGGARQVLLDRLLTENHARAEGAKSE